MAKLKTCYFWSTETDLRQYQTQNKTLVSHRVRAGVATRIKPKTTNDEVVFRIA